MRRSGMKRCKKKKNLEKILFGLLISAVIVNLVGVFAPELSFDALWYHLTLPKLYLKANFIKFYSGGLLYYSAFPQLAEMLYTIGLSLGSELIPKFIHFLFGIGVLVLLYKWLRKNFDSSWAFFGCLFFYTQLVVGWLSITAYIDLARAFFELLGLLAFLKWLKNDNLKWIIESGVMIGLAISTKLLSLSSVLVFSILILYRKRKIGRGLVLFNLFAFIIPLPWFVWTFLQTNKIIYPVFTDWFFKGQSQGLSLSSWFLSRHPINLIKSLIQTTFTKGDILTPLILMFLPILFLYKGRKQRDQIKYIKLYLILNFLVWFFIPLNYNRFLFIYVPAYIYLLIDKIKNKQEHK
jgi:4-amino-4-deoxy-L-arabinose transferase-like glycosyltransferase